MKRQQACSRYCFIHNAHGSPVVYGKRRGSGHTTSGVLQCLRTRFFRCPLRCAPVVKVAIQIYLVCVEKLNPHSSHTLVCALKSFLPQEFHLVTTNIIGKSEANVFFRQVVLPGDPPESPAIPVVVVQSEKELWSKGGWFKREGGGEREL